MRVNNYFRTMILFVAAFLLASAAMAQDGKPAEGQREEGRQEIGQRRDNRVDLLHQLGLTEEQLQQIRKINMEKRSLIEDAQKRLREATRALNEAIYADQVNESDVDARLNDRLTAQTAVERLRFLNEFAVRRVLTPEQLIKFRELRQRFEKMRNGLKSRQFDRVLPRHRQARDPSISQTSDPLAQPARIKEQAPPDL